jgi:CheY-like chemotaxis protein
MHKVLIIDDEPVVRMMYKRYLLEKGYEVWTAEDGKAGQRMCREIRPDIVVTDIMMPEQDGFETINLLRTEFPELPIIAMSGAIGPIAQEGIMALGAIMYINKPVELAVLARMIAGILSNVAAKAAETPRNSATEGY